MNMNQSDFISELYNMYALKMIRFTYNRVKNYELAKDLVQDTFQIASYKSELIVNHSNPVGWLFVTLKMLTMRELKKSYHSEVTLEYNITVECCELSLPIDLYIPQGISDSDRKLITLRVIDEMSLAEISKLEGITETACRKRVSRAFRKCRNLLAKE